MKHVADILIVAGASAVSYGAWLAWPPLGPIVAGSFAITVALNIARGQYDR